MKVAMRDEWPHWQAARKAAVSGGDADCSNMIDGTVGGDVDGEEESAIFETGDTDNFKDIGNPT